MTKKQIKNSLLFLLLTIVIAFISSFIYQNFEVLKINKNDRVVSNISLDEIEYNCFEKQDDKLVKTCEDTSITIKNDNKYLNKLLFTYESSEDLEWTISYTENDFYGNDKVSTKQGSNIHLINTFSEVLNNNIKEIKINIKDESELSISNVRVDNKIHLSIQVLFTFELIALCIYVLIIFRKKFNHHFEYLFLTLATTFGLIILVLTPNISGTSWDDQIHFNSSYSMLQGQGIIYTEAADYSSDATAHSASKFNTNDERDEYYKYLNSHNKDVYSMTDETSGLISYSEVGYVPSAIVLKMCSILHVPFSITFFLGRAVNLILYIGIIFLAIKVSTRYKKVIGFIGLIPTELFLATQYNRDSFIVCFILLGLAYFIKEFTSKDKLSKKSLAIFLGSIFVASCAKPVYFPLFALLILLPKDKFNSKKSAWIIKTLSIIICLLMLATFVLPAASGQIAGDARGGDTSVTEQMKLILKQPLSFAKVMDYSAIKSFMPYYIGSGALTSFGYATKYLSGNCYYLLLIVLILTFIFDDNEKIKFNYKHLIWIFLINLASWGMIWGSLYLLFTPVGANWIGGVQPRYFIPLLLPTILLLNNLKTGSYSSKRLNTIISIVMILSYTYYIFADFMFI